MGDEKVLYKDLSYKVMGVIFNVYNSIGGGPQEKYIQRAIANELEKATISYKRELKVPIVYDGKEIGYYFLNFLIDNKIVLEIKKAYKFTKKYFEQVSAYLKVKGLKLGILVLFTNIKVKFIRVLNLY